MHSRFMQAKDKVSYRREKDASWICFSPFKIDKMFWMKLFFSMKIIQPEWGIGSAQLNQYMSNRLLSKNSPV